MTPPSPSQEARVARGQPRTSIVFSTRPRASRAMLRKVPNSAPTNSARPRVGETVKNRLVGDAITILTRGQPRAGDAVTTRPRPTLGGRCSHDSPAANPGRETQSRLARGQPWVGDLVTTLSRRIPGRRRSHDSSEGNNSGIWSCFTILIMFATQNLYFKVMFLVSYLRNAWTHT